MPDIPVYMVANLEVDDAARYLEYEKGFFPILKKHGGEFLTFDDATSTLEGSAPPPGRIVIFRFPSEDKMIMEIHDLPIGETNTMVVEITYTRS